MASGRGGLNRGESAMWLRQSPALGLDVLAVCLRGSGRCRFEGLKWAFPTPRNTTEAPPQRVLQRGLVGRARVSS